MNPLKEEILTAYRNNDQKNIPICSVCQDSFTKKQFASDSRTDKVHQIGCGHLFHTNCITSAFAHKPQCPLCRHEIVDLAPHKDWETFRKSILETLITSKDEESEEEIGGIDVKPSPFERQTQDPRMDPFLLPFLENPIESQFFDFTPRHNVQEFREMFIPEPQFSIRDFTNFFQELRARQEIAVESLVDQATEIQALDFSDIFDEIRAEPEAVPSLLDRAISIIDEATSHISNLFLSIFS